MYIELKDARIFKCCDVKVGVSGKYDSPVGSIYFNPDFMSKLELEKQDSYYVIRVYDVKYSLMFMIFCDKVYELDAYDIYKVYKTYE